MASTSVTLKSVEISRKMSSDTGQQAAKGQPDRSPMNSSRFKVGLLLAGCVWCVELSRLNFNVILPFVLNVTVPSVHWSNDTAQMTSRSTALQTESRGPVVHLMTWTPLQQTWVLAAFYAGSASIGPLAAKICMSKAPRDILVVTVSVISLVSVFVPTAVVYGWPAVCVLRFVQGIAKAFILPSILRVVHLWIPSNERPATFLLLLISMALAHVIGSPAFVILSTIKPTHGGWALTFYVSAILGFIWMAVWVLSFTNHPQRHDGIARNEKHLLLDALEQQMFACQMFQPSENHWQSTLRSRSTTVFALANLPYFCVFVLWDALGLVFLKMIVQLPISAGFFGFFDAAPFFCFSVFVFIFNQIRSRVDSEGDENGRLRRIFTVIGLSFAVTTPLLFMFLHSFGYWWILVILCVGACLAAAYSQSYSNVCFQLSHFRKYSNFLVISSCICDAFACISIIAIGVLHMFMQLKAWLTVCAVLSFFAFGVSIAVIAVAPGTKSKSLRERTRGIRSLRNIFHEESVQL